MNDLTHYLAFNLARAMSALLDRESFLYWPFILSSIVLALAVWRRPWREFWREYFGAGLWWHRSARADYLLYFVNALVLPALFAFLLPDANQLADPAGGVLVRALYTVAFFVAYDFGRFAAHCLLHDVPLLWEFHKIHHSAQVLTPMTAYRAHPLELLLMAWGPVITTGLVSVAFNAIAGGGVGFYSFLGLHVFLFGFNLIDNLRHSPVWLSYGAFWGRWLISPAHHQLHHSCEVRHFGCNRGFALALWDRLYGTLYVPGTRPETFKLGLGDGSDERYHHVGRMYWLPFAAAARQTAKTLFRFSPARPGEPRRPPT
jgi:sterol desaturase/sphingolipid hydroxylase (fatty acid hydroxylase superfamily)